MNRTYDNLTPSQKAKLTRLINKLDDQKWAASRIQYAAYQAKQDEIQTEQQPRREQIQSEAAEKIAALREQIIEIDKQMRAELQGLYNEQREQTKPLFEAYETARTLAHEWHKVEEAKVVDKFYTEVEAGN